MQDLCDNAAARGVAVARAAADVPSSELEPVPLYMLSLRQYERRCTLTLPPEVKRSKNILAAFRNWLRTNAIATKLHNIQLRRDFAASKINATWLPTF